ncbi:unnamed protein product [Thelazia callipaeda]|uniref:Restriction endonuclease n=1 Tax=Thelazia callipaeda TaxID=103827 RepID=A0A158RBR3_THECL|nr:unnamed protein product [Thelazia callipaeda]
MVKEIAGSGYKIVVTIDFLTASVFWALLRFLGENMTKAQAIPSFRSLRRAWRGFRPEVLELLKQSLVKSKKSKRVKPNVRKSRNSRNSNNNRIPRNRRTPVICRSPIYLRSCANRVNPINPPSSTEHRDSNEHNTHCTRGSNKHNTHRTRRSSNKHNTHCTRGSNNEATLKKSETSSKVQDTVKPKTIGYPLFCPYCDGNLRAIDKHREDGKFALQCRNRKCLKFLGLTSPENKRLLHTSHLSEYGWYMSNPVKHAYRIIRDDEYPPDCKRRVPTPIIENGHLMIHILGQKALVQML